MMPLIDKDTPGDGETWQELADHSLTHDDLPLHWHLASGAGIAPHVRTVRRLKTSAANPLRLCLVPCTGKIIPGGEHAGRCENHAGRFGWMPQASLPESRNAVCLDQATERQAS